MFIKEDYVNYLAEIEGILKKSITLYTDLINIIDDKSIRGNLTAMVKESMDHYRFINATKEKFL